MGKTPNSKFWSPLKNPKLQIPPAPPDGAPPPRRGPKTKGSGRRTTFRSRNLLKTNGSGHRATFRSCTPRGILWAPLARNPEKNVYPGAMAGTMAWEFGAQRSAKPQRALVWVGIASGPCVRCMVGTSNRHRISAGRPHSTHEQSAWHAPPPHNLDAGWCCVRRADRSRVTEKPQIPKPVLGRIHPPCWRASAAEEHPSGVSIQPSGK